MSGRQLPSVLGYLRKMVQPPHGGTSADDLQWFARNGDPAAFGALVQRHGPMVLRVCNQVLQNRHDAEDAFQATFLVLLRKAGAIGRPELLANWLYGVAYRVARRAKVQTVRRRLREIEGGAHKTNASA